MAVVFFFFLDNANKVKLATIVKGDPKAPFSIAITPGEEESSTPVVYSIHGQSDNDFEETSSTAQVFNQLEPNGLIRELNLLKKASILVGAQKLRCYLTDRLVPDY